MSASAVELDVTLRLKRRGEGWELRVICGEELDTLEFESLGLLSRDFQDIVACALESGAAREIAAGRQALENFKRNGGGPERRGE